MNVRVLMIAGLAALWAVGLYGIVTLPQTIPVRWDNAGHISEYGSKYVLLLLPLAGAFAFAILTLASGFMQPVPPMIAAWRATALAVVGAELTVGFALIETAIVGSSATGHLWQAFPFFIGAFSVIIV